MVPAAELAKFDSATVVVSKMAGVRPFSYMTSKILMAATMKTVLSM
jgi:hypothetical protein